MAIRVRRGLEADFDASKMLPGEWAVSTDTRYVRMCFAPGIVMRMATYESFEADMAQIRTILAECKSIQSAIQRIQSEVNAKAALTIEYANAAAESAEKAAESEAKAKMYAENAEAVTGVGIASQKKAGLVKGGENYIDESGELQLTKRTDFPTLYNSYAGGIKLNELCGVSEQDSTTGAQLFDGNLVNALYTNGAWEAESTVYRSIEIEVETAGSYSISFETEVMINREDGVITEKQGTHFVFDFEVGTHIISFRKNPSAEWGTGMNIMLNAGSTALPWEPYTGNAASPSPEYPQVIKSVEVSGFWGHGKNFLNPTLGTTSKNNITCTNNGNGTYTLNGTAQYATTFILQTNITVNGLYNLVGCPNDGDASTYFLQLNSSNVAITDVGKGTSKQINGTFELRISIKQGVTCNNVVFKPMLTTDLTATYDTYEPYTEQSHTLSNPIKLNGVGTSQDKFVRKDGVWKIERNAYEIVANSLTEFNTAYGCGYVSIPKGTIKTQNWNVAEENAMSNIFNNMISVSTLINNSDREELAIYTTSATDTREGVIFRITSIEQTEEAYNAFLAETPLVVSVERATPTYEDLPTADQIALNSLVSYDGITYLYCDSEVQPTWDLEYGTSRVGGYTLEAWNKEENNRIKIEELTAAMLVMNQE